MALNAAFIFLVGDADENTRTVVSTPSIDLNVVGCKNYAEAEAAAKELAAQGVTAMELCAGFGNEGIARIQSSHPDVDIYCGTVDEGLNERGYIVPGLGDAGDRIFGTK